MNQQNQDGNEPGHNGTSAPSEGIPDAASPPGLSSTTESDAVTHTDGNQDTTALQEGPTDSFSSQDNPPAEDAEDLEMADVRGRGSIKPSAKFDKIMKERAKKGLLRPEGNRNLRLANHKGQKGKNDNVPGSGTTGPEVKTESPEQVGETAGQPSLSRDDNEAKKSHSVEAYNPQHDPNYSKFGAPIDTFSAEQHDQGEFMYWLSYHRERYYVVKFGSNDAPKYRIVLDVEWRGKEPDIRPENCVTHPKFRELECLNELGKPVYTWRDVTAVRGVAWIEKNGEGLDGIDPREKTWCSWSIDPPGDEEKPVHQRLRIRDRSHGRRAQTFNYTLIFCEVQKKGSQEKVECVINRNTYRSILRAGKNAADITLFIHAEYAEKRHNGQIVRKSSSPSRDFGRYLRQCSVAPDSWQERKSHFSEHGETDEESDASEESGDETEFHRSPSRRSSNRGSRRANSRRQKSDTSEGSGDESDSSSDSPQHSFDRGTHRTKYKRKGGLNYGRGSRNQDKDRLDEILRMLQDLSQRVRRLEDDAGKSRISKKRG